MTRKKKRKHTIVSTGIIPMIAMPLDPRKKSRTWKKWSIVDTKKMKRKKGKSGKPFKF